MENHKDTITLTFGDQAENHKGMQIIGKKSEKGFSIKDLETANAFFREKGCVTVMLNLNKLISGIESQQAHILIVRKGVNAILDDEKGADKMYEEQRSLPRDKKAFMYGRVVNKKARWNLCFGEKSQKANYEEKKGTIISFDKVPMLKRVRKNIVNSIGDIAKELQVEGNYYYDPKKCFIGFHGDFERRKVIGVRLGASFKFHYQWYLQNKEIGKRMTITLNHGDLYIMSEKAVGTDWKCKSIPTLRHAAGDEKALKLSGNCVNEDFCRSKAVKEEFDDEGYKTIIFLDRFGKVILEK